MLKSSSHDLGYLEYIQHFESGRIRMPLTLEGNVRVDSIIISSLKDIVHNYFNRPKAYPLSIKADLYKILAELFRRAF